MLDRIATFRVHLWLILAVFLGGCQVYEVNAPVIPANLGTSVPLSSPVTWGDGGSTAFSYSQTNREYRFQNDDGSTGTARAMRLRDNDYVIQEHYDGDATYVIHLVRVDPSRDTAYGLELGFDPVPVAARHRVTVREGVFTAYILQGNPTDILNFLRQHAQLPLRQEAF